MEFYSDDKPEKCPQCGSPQIATFLYGIQSYSEDLMTEIKDGKIILGGCTISGYDPDWRCNDCKAEIFKKDSRA